MEFVSGVAGKVSGKLATAAFKELAKAWRLQKDVQMLQDSISIINAFLNDAENKQQGNDAITEWLRRLKHAFLDACDVLDEIECEALRNEVVKKYGSFPRKVRRFFSSSNKIAFSVQMTHKIKGIRERINGIASLRADLGVVDDHHAHNLFLSQRETCSKAEHSLVIGRDKEKEEIIDFLINSHSLDNGIDVIPIVGLGGLGKTTLAKLVYNDNRVKQYFDPQAWVCVSDKFDVKRIVLEILKSLGEEGSNDENLQQLQTRLHNKLQQKRFLIVMDDVWNDDRKKWLDLTALFMDNCLERNKNDSKIIITTRENNVAAITRTTSAQVNLRELDEDECLEVFTRHAFDKVVGDKEKYPSLVEIGKEIVKKCKGVPLAVVSLGCLLYSRVDESKWKEIRDSQIWELDRNNILPALMLSYNHLPPQLKQCVSYCSIFPKDFKYSNEELISFWLAHGLLESSSKENVKLEDLGHYYINELLSRFFFQDLEDSDMSRTKWCFFKMHDLIHDLAMSTMQSELAIVTSDFESINERIRHLVVSKDSEGVPNFCQSLRKVGTFCLSHTSYEENFINTEQFVAWICHQFKYLKVLDLHKSKLVRLPDCISKMKHLRSIILQYCMRMKELPESICKLQNLQKLDVWGCYKLQKLPKNMKILVSLRVLWVTTQESDLSNCGIWCLESLQYLYFHGCENLVSLPHTLSHLTSLKNLGVDDCEMFLNFEEEDDDEKRESKEVKDLSLQGLVIDTLPKLTTLPRWLERSAKTMQHIFIGRCVSFTALPEWLPNLTTLEIFASDNPRLIANCQKYGPKWSKIAHLSYLSRREVDEHFVTEAYYAPSFMYGPSKSNAASATEARNDEASSSAA